MYSNENYMYWCEPTIILSNNYKCYICYYRTFTHLVCLFFFSEENLRIEITSIQTASEGLHCTYIIILKDNGLTHNRQVLLL